MVGPPSEFRWGGRPLEPLKALDREERVVYVGSFSKTMFAALRVGYAVLPRTLVRPVASAKALYEPGPPAACFAFSHLDELTLIEGVFRMKAAWGDI